MAIITGLKANRTLRFWEASLAWKMGGKWAEGWTNETFIDVCREVCNDNGNLGARCDELLHHMVQGKERDLRESPGQLIPLHMKTFNLGHLMEDSIAS